MAKTKAQSGIEIPRKVVEFILLGPEDDRRQLQDSPILGDVWVEFARNPGRKLELLITPYKEYAAGTVARALSNCSDIRNADIAYLQGIVAARLTFEEVVRFVVPMTYWWNDRNNGTEIARYLDDPALAADVATILEVAQPLEARKGRGAQERRERQDRQKKRVSMRDLDTRKRYLALAGLILWAERQRPRTPPAGKEAASRIVGGLKDLFKKSAATADASLVWTISLNRQASPALTRSVAAVKADAAKTLFTVDCRDIVWAVVDAGIDATHDAFRDTNDPNRRTRIKRAFDFTRIREIVSLDNLDDKTLAGRVRELSGLKLKQPVKDAKKTLKQLAQAARDGHSINWEFVEPFVEIDPEDADNRPTSHHGTHVAGILAADKRGGGNGDATDWANGMCPEIAVYDFRVLAPTLNETEFAIIAALQYIRYINERNSFITIHGANLSLSIPHDVRNYACGRTPVCNECERLVNSGVVVVAAAGNRGYQNFETKEGLYEGYAAFSVTDPGNADGVITVGATHRFWPHTYGVSFFSSRGPTGDGRLKPDLVAPGERIRAPLPGNVWGDLDGTSMAAPHVSGAAAMLMARYSELVGQPRRIKDILCRSATDLGRERSFQGNGMLDVLRAFQSV